MEVSMVTLLASLWMKTLLNWVVLVVQKGHVGRSFWSVFCVSVALGDTLLDLSVTCVFLAQDVQVFGLHLTKYHVCVLVQAACSVQGVLHWPVFILSGLDVLWSRRRSCPRSPQTLVHTTTVFLLWTLAVMYIFTVPDSHPLTRDEDNHITLQRCQVMGGAQSRQVALASLLTLVGVACYMRSSVRSTNTEQLRECVCHFLSTWSSFLLLLLFILASGTEVPPYLDMNGVWLCFIHSLLTAVALTSCSCVFCTHTQDDTWKSCTGLTHICFLRDKLGFTAETLPAQTLHTRRLA
ncbi:probable G-protein coupled receptor 160 [Ictalurus punctatus]|uniref:Probable G-protein coupled receptor 160 n=1 Tax=Ictalurus punctatus TaxID=7998 RepID=A0A2D0R8U4_ICTPU|nr:probable G-protein coupled receptor 160 [Ictalurus punctatus]